MVWLRNSQFFRILIELKPLTLVLRPKKTFSALQNVEPGMAIKKIYLTLLLEAILKREKEKAHNCLQKKKKKSLKWQLQLLRARLWEETSKDTPYSRWFQKSHLHPAPTPTSVHLKHMGKRQIGRCAGACLEKKKNHFRNLSPSRTFARAPLAGKPARWVEGLAIQTE